MAKTVQKSETFVMFETLRLLQYLSFILPLCNIHTLYIVLCSFACILLCYQERQILIVLYLYPVEWICLKFSVKSKVLLLSRWVLQYCYFLSFAYKLSISNLLLFPHGLLNNGFAIYPETLINVQEVSSFLSFHNLCC